VGTGLAAKGSLQGWVRAQAGGNFSEAMCAGQDRDEGGCEVVGWGILPRLLGNLHAVAHTAKQIDLAQMPAPGAPAGGWRKVPGRFETDKLCHGDEPPSVGYDVTPKCRFITASCPRPVG